jgi:hypothetical protein
MRMRKILRSKVFWGGAIAGWLGGPWVASKARQITNKGGS